MLDGRKNNDGGDSEALRLMCGMPHEVQVLYATAVSAMLEKDRQPAVAASVHAPPRIATNRI